MTTKGPVASSTAKSTSSKPPTTTAKRSNNTGTSQAKQNEDPKKRRRIEKEYNTSKTQNGVDEQIDGEEEGDSLQFCPTGFTKVPVSSSLLDASLLENSHTELWLIKTPSNFEVGSFEGVELDVNELLALSPEGVGGEQAQSLEVPIGGKTYAVSPMTASEYRQVLNLFPSSHIHRLLLGKPFAHGFSLTERVAVPRAPRPSQPLKKAVVPQIPNLRLRYRPPGYVFSEEEAIEVSKQKSKYRKMLAKVEVAAPPRSSHTQQHEQEHEEKQDENQEQTEDGGEEQEPEEEEEEQEEKEEQDEEQEEARPQSEEEENSTSESET
jgi:hypothetical protein